MELKYNQYSKVDFVFRRPDGTHLIASRTLGGIIISQLTYLLQDSIFNAPGQVIGYLKFYTQQYIYATLYFDFLIIPALLP